MQKNILKKKYLKNGNKIVKLTYLKKLKHI